PPPYTHTLSLHDALPIFLADFVNTTGDSAFDDTLKQGLRVQLEQSPFLNILSDQKASDVLQMMKRSKDERLTREVTREVCQRARSEEHTSELQSRGHLVC